MRSSCMISRGVFFVFPPDRATAYEADLAAVIGLGASFGSRIDTDII